MLKFINFLSKFTICFKEVYCFVLDHEPVGHGLDMPVLDLTDLATGSEA